jgi:hypothetical protein
MNTRAHAGTQDAANLMKNEANPMKRAVAVVVGVAILGVIPVSQARPKAPSTADDSSSAPGVAPTVYYKPSKDGSNTTPSADKTVVTLACQPNAQQPSFGFAIVIANGQAYCRAALADVDLAQVVCEAGGTLKTDDQFAPAVKAAFKLADACLKGSSPADAPASYFEPTCGTSSTGSGHVRRIKAGADSCEKVINRMKLQTPGDTGNVLTLPTVIGAGKEIVPTQAQIDSKSLKCPAGATLEQSGNGAVCKKG